MFTETLLPSPEMYFFQYFILVCALSYKLVEPHTTMAQSVPESWLQSICLTVPDCHSTKQYQYSLHNFTRLEQSMYQIFSSSETLTLQPCQTCPRLLLTAFSHLFHTQRITFRKKICLCVRMCTCACVFMDSYGLILFCHLNCRLVYLIVDLVLLCLLFQLQVLLLSR